MSVKLLDAALADLTSDAPFYEARSTGPGEAFIAEVEAASEFLVRFPRAGRPAAASARDVRRFAIQKFPYAIIYVVQDDGLLVLVVAHAKRDPSYWESRIPAR